MTTQEKFTAQVTLPSDTEVRVTRSFDAPRTLVWQAHTVPELARRWMLGYPGWSMTVCEMDVRPGGKYRWRWRWDENDQEFGFFGTFTEVDEPATLSHDEYYDPGEFDFGGTLPTEKPTRIRASFTEENGVTTLVTLMDFGSKEARDSAISTGMTDGMEVNYQNLDRLLVEQR